MGTTNAAISEPKSSLSFKNTLIIIGLFLGVFVVGADSFIISPLLKTVGQSLNGSVDQVGYAVAAYGICYALGAPFFGPLGDRLSRKVMMLCGLTVFCIGTLLCGFAHNLTTFYVYRAIAGIGAALFTPNVWAFIGGHFSGPKMGKVMGIVMSALSLSIVLGVPLGSFIAQVSSWNWTFFSLVILGCVAWLVVLIQIPYFRNPAAGQFKYWSNFAQVFKAKNGTLALFITLTWMFAFYSIYTYLGTFVHDSFHYDTEKVGLVMLTYGAGNFIASFFGGWVLAKLGARKSLMINGIIATIVIAIMAQTGGHLGGLIVVLLILAFAEGFGVTSLSAFIATIVPANRSTMMALNNAFIYLGLTLGSSIGGSIYTSASFVTLGIVAAVVNLVSVFIAATLRNPQKS